MTFAEVVPFFTQPHGPVCVLINFDLQGRGGKELKKVMFGNGTFFHTHRYYKGGGGSLPIRGAGVSACCCIVKALAGGCDSGRPAPIRT